MGLRFHKMHGCGNDFIVVDDPAGAYSWDVLGGLARRWCDRRFGVGGDGIIAVGHGPLAGESWPDDADYEMRYVNADGSRAEMCGNGIRCVGKYAADVLGDSRDEIAVLTGNGVLPIRLLRAPDGTVEQISVDMGVPRLAPVQIPTTLGDGADEPLVRRPLTVGGTELAVTTVNMGNPHAVSFVEAIRDEHVHGLGPQVETNPAFPQKTNVEFVEALSPGELRMRVWERGVGETWACGTGACASVVAAVLEGRSHGREVVVHLNGGDLTISWAGAGQPVQMTGPAEIVFTGELPL